MGKRELLIVLVFVVVGMAVYEVTAPPAQPGQGFSWSHLWTNARRGFTPTREHAQWTSKQSVAAPDSVREVRVRGANGHVEITGQTRADIEVNVVVDAIGADTAAALALAKRAQVTIDRLDDTVTVSVRPAAAPPAGRPGGFSSQVVNITLNVPARLAASLDGGSGVTIAGVSAVTIRGTSGKTSIARVAGPVSGDYRGGSLDISDVGNVDLTLTNAETTVAGVHKASRLEIVNGSCGISGGSAGALDIDARQATIQITANAAPVTIGGTGGRVDLRQPEHEVHLDMRRTRVSVLLSAAVPLSLTTSDDAIDVTLDTTPPHVEIDALAEDGDVLASDVGLTATKSDRDSRLEHSFGAGPRVSLRTSNGNIVIKKKATH